MNKIMLTLFLLCPSLQAMQTAIHKSPELDFAEILVIKLEQTGQTDIPSPESKTEPKRHRVERTNTNVDNNRTKVKLAVIAMVTSIIGGGITLAIHLTK